MNISNSKRILACALLTGAMSGAPSVFAGIEDIPVAGAAMSSELSGTVTVVNLEKRMMTIKTPEGRFEVLHVPETVKRLDQVKVGNLVTISEIEAVLVDLQKGSDAGTIGVTENTSTEAEPGVKPAGVIVDNLTLYGKVEAVDKVNSTVTVRGPERTVTLNVRDPELLDMVSPGDGVVAKYMRLIQGEVTFQ